MKSLDEKINQISEYNDNKKILDFIRKCKDKFGHMEGEIDRLRAELLYYQRKTKEQEQTIEDLRRKEK